MASRATSTLAVQFVATDEELRRLAVVFDIDPEASNLEEQLEPWLTAIAGAALQEYVLAFAGTRSPNTIREVRELRLRLLYDHLGDGAPSDAQVAQLFELTTTQTRNLIAGTQARYRPELEGTLSSRAVHALEQSTYIDKGIARVVLPGSVAVYLSDLISETECPPLEKVKDASRTYDIKRSTADALGKRLGFDASTLKGFKEP
jgi:hypothetical protein